jgi:CHASE3 domain sensor protein
MTEKVHVLNFLSVDPPGVTPAAESDLERRARQIGALAGRAVALLRQTQERLNDQESWNNLRGSAEDRAEEIRHAAARRTQEWRRQAEKSYQQAREHARETARDYPLHVALAAGVAGFVVGAALRIGRTHRAR